MIIFTNANGTLLNVMPERVYQGSNEANQIYLIAPFAQTNTVEIAFKLPQTGMYTEPYLMTFQQQLTGLVTEDNKPLSGWVINIPIEVTEYYGKVTLQIYVKALQDEKTITIATAGTTFEVERGVKPILPDEPSEDVYDQILAIISGIQSDLDNGQLSAIELTGSANSNSGAKGFSLNALVWFFEAKCLAQSLVDNNEEPLYLEDGSINSEYWHLFLQDSSAIAEDVAQAVSTANQAKTISETASSTASTANTTANEAKTLANEAKDIAQEATSVTVNGEKQSTWNADTKADVNAANISGDNITLWQNKLDIVTKSTSEDSIDFAQNELNKTLNLLPLRPNGTYVTGSNTMTINGDTISMQATTSTDGGLAFYLSGVNNEVKLKSGHTYTLKAFDVTGNTGNNLITGRVEKSDGTTANDYIYFYFPNTSTTFTLTEDVTLLGVNFYTTAGNAFDCSFKMGLFEDDNPTIYYPYNGELVNQREITSDVLYDKDSTHWEINKGYTSGIMSNGENSGGISFPELSSNSYKALLITAQLDGVIKTERVPLLNLIYGWSITIGDLATNKTAYNYISGYIRFPENIIRVVFAGIVFSRGSGATDKNNNADYIITKIEGVK